MDVNDSVALLFQLGHRLCQQVVDLAEVFRALPRKDLSIGFKGFQVNKAHNDYPFFCENFRKEKTVQGIGLHGVHHRRNPDGINTFQKHFPLAKKMSKGYNIPAVREFPLCRCSDHLRRCKRAPTLLHCLSVIFLENIVSQSRRKCNFYFQKV